jgi:hypothetical protein
MEKKPGDDRSKLGPTRRKQSAETSIKESEEEESYPEGSEDFIKVFQELLTSSPARYLAGGIGAALLGLVAQKMSQRYPEISYYLRKNKKLLERKIDSLKEDMAQMLPPGH